jgi:HSP20 family protein
MNTYDIFDDVLNLRDLVNTFFNESSARWQNREFPHIEMYEGKDDLEIRALMPGVKSEEMDIQLINDSLVIEGTKKNDYIDQMYLRKEHQFGSFKKSIKLPYRVDHEKITAELNNGILHIRLTKSADAKPKKIEIH